MVRKWTPEINKVYTIDRYSFFQVLEGSGGIQVDFKNYYNWQNKAIYLEKGQYIKFMSDNFLVRQIEFPDEILSRNDDVRVLFKHLVSLGYINFTECEECVRQLSDTTTSESSSTLIDISSHQWYVQDPFRANKEEYQVIFDLKEVIDQHYSESLSSSELTSLASTSGYETQTLVKDKIGLTVKALYSRKKLVESQKEVAFTDKNIQEIAYDMGYSDPSYFGRFFRNNTGKTPAQFRQDFDYINRDMFTQNITELLRTHHMEHRQLGFYADKMNLSVKALSRKVKDKTNTSLGQLIRLEVIHTAKKMLSQGASVKDISIHLGFEEPNHFSSFFKHYTGHTPGDFRNKKSQT